MDKLNNKIQNVEIKNLDIDEIENVSIYIENSSYLVGKNIYNIIPDEIVFKTTSFSGQKLKVKYKVEKQFYERIMEEG